MEEKLTQKLIRDLFDYKEGILYWKESKGNQVKIGDKAGGMRKDGYYTIRINNKKYLNHRLIYLYHNGYLPKYIDHIDGNKSNNKIENLREVTQSQNFMNKKSHKNTSSKYKGVCWHKIGKKWQVSIRINGKQIYLGLFINEHAAAIAYNNTAIKYYREFANLNNIKR